jgi:DNA-binding NarL/FixJ family response regulator
MADEPIKIVIADDHPIVRNGLRQVMDADPGLNVVGEADDGRQAVQMIRELGPDVAVLDIDMPELDGFGVAEALEEEGIPVRIIFLTVHGDEDLFHAAMEHGARGYIRKDSALLEIVNGIKQVAAGNYFVPPALTSFLIKPQRPVQPAEAGPPGLSLLTPTERRVLLMLADYKSSKEIAEALFIHSRTVDNHRNNISQKLDLHGRNSLLKFAIENRSRL